MKVLIDDMRNINADIICRNYDAAQRFLLVFLSNVTYLMLDNDLGESDPKKDGYAIACWIEERHADFGEAALPNTIEIVTSNPAASAKMEQIFAKLYEYRKGRVFSKEQIP